MAYNIAVYGCEQDEADLFHELSPRFGVVPTTMSNPVSQTRVMSAPQTRCVSVGHKSELSGRHLRALKEAGVEYVCTRSIGFDHIDVTAARELGIAVDNVAYAPDGVADYTLMLMLMAIRNAKETVNAVARCDFRLSSVRGKDLRDMTVGVVGVGHIGQAVITRLRGFGCRVLAYNNNQPAAALADFVSFRDLLLESDIVTLHVPLSTNTHHLIGSEQIEAMKTGSFLINTGRGPLVDTAALIMALERGKLGGVALDVVEGEKGFFYFDHSKRPLDNHFLARLQTLPNAIVTPHTAYYTGRALYDTVEGTLVNCLNFERTWTNGETQDRDLVRGVLGGA